MLLLLWSSSSAILAEGLRSVKICVFPRSRWPRYYYLAFSAQTGEEKGFRGGFPPSFFPALRPPWARPCPRRRGGGGSEGASRTGTAAAASSTSIATGATGSGATTAGGGEGPRQESEEWEVAQRGLRRPPPPLPFEQEPRVRVRRLLLEVQEGPRREEEEQ